LKGCDELALPPAGVCAIGKLPVGANIGIPSGLINGPDFAVVACTFAVVAGAADSDADSMSTSSSAPTEVFIAASDSCSFANLDE
ncbi:MAG: hypothetical protein ACKPKO_06215, partial [Candidatus Fonsibacter sp.]